MSGVTFVQTKEETEIWPFLEKSMKEIGFPEQAVSSYYDKLSDVKVKIAARMGEDLAGVLIGSEPEGGVGTILWLMIDPQFRGQGIGSRMYGMARKEYQKMGCHKIKLTAPNKQAVRFYEKQGMKLEGFLPHHWWHMDFWCLGETL